MRYALTAGQMRAAEEDAIERGLVSLGVLMERAGRVLADEAERLVTQGVACVVCGAGNNGGDGWVAARHLAAGGREVRVIALAAPDDLRGAAADAASEAIAAGVDWHMPGSAFDLTTRLSEASVIVDCVFGFGFHGAASGPTASAIEAINDADALVIAADLPSGVAADTGAVGGPAVMADVTVTFSAPKPGLLIDPGAQHAGEIVVADLGIPRESLDAHGTLEIWDIGDLRSVFPAPRPADHKGSRGRVLVVAGSAAFTGAAVLTAEGALRMGAGYVYVATPEPVAPIVRAALPNVIVRALPASPDGAIASADDVRGVASDADAIVVGPGLTMAPGVSATVGMLLAHAAPLVIDADALNVLAADGLQPLEARVAPCVVTPHPGEMGRLLDVTPEVVEADRVGAAARFDGTARACLLKGPHSIVAGEGRRAIVLAGNAGLARAGSGDVLAGMVGTLLAQGLSPFEASMLGAYLHGRAADHGAEALTPTCLTAVDIVRFLPDAVRELLGG